MKSTLFSFLYICLGILQLLLCPNNLYAQTDSILYYRNSILQPKNSNSINEAFRFYEKSIEQHLKKGDTLAAVQELRLEAIGQMELGLLIEGEATAVKALTYLRTINESPATHEAQKGLYNYLGTIYRRLKDYDNAVSYLNNALEYANQTSDSVTIFNNIATIYIDQELYSKATELLTDAYLKSIHLNNIPLKARALDNLGYSQSKLGMEEGYANLLRALDLRLATKDLTGTYASYKHLASYFAGINNKNKAQEYSFKCYQLAKDLNSPVYIEDALSALLKLNSDTLTKDYIRISDSLEQARQAAQNKYAFMKYNLDEERRKTQEQKLLKEEEKNKKLFSQALALVIVLILAFIIYILRLRFQKEKLNEIYKTETKISKKIHDEVANDIFNTITYIQNNALNNHESTEIIITNLEDIYTKSRDISKEYNTIEVGKHFKNQLTDMISTFNSTSLGITLMGHEFIDWETLNESKKNVCYRIIQELLINTKKHSMATMVAITLYSDKKTITIKYADNGKGTTLDLKKKKGGLNNVENRIKDINGNVTFETRPGKGFKSIINFPV